MNGGLFQIKRFLRQPGFCLAGLLVVHLLLNSLLTAVSVGICGPLSGGFLSEPSKAPCCIRSEAERAGHLAVIRTGAGTGLQISVRTGRASLGSVQKLQSDISCPKLFRLREPSPNCPFRIEFSGQSCLFQLFPRSYLPVRAGPFPLC